MGLEAKICETIVTRLAILDWVIALAPDIINKFLVGSDGKTAHQRIHNRPFSMKAFEIGEQVMAKPKRKKSSKLKRSLVSQWRVPPGSATAQRLESISWCYLMAAQPSRSARLGRGQIQKGGARRQYAVLLRLPTFPIHKTLRKMT